VWTWDWMYYTPHDSSTLACSARQGAEIAGPLWTFEAAVDHMALCVRALVPEDGDRGK
jgi:hypothetical protein